MELSIENDNPSIIRIKNFDDPHGSIAESLTYRDKSAQFQYLRFKNSAFFKAKMDSEKYEARLTELKSQIVKSILFKDELGYFTYSGLQKYLSSKLRIPVINNVQYPTPNKLPWVKEPEFKPYPYQIESHDKILAAKHAGVEIATGLGKTLVITHLVRNLGLKTIIMTPATNISEQIYDELILRLGKKYIGAFFDGKKESKKLIVVANAQSLTRVEPGNPHWDNLNQSKVFVIDESHTIPSVTFEKVCAGVAAKAPYRFFFSATQTRGDGKTLTLEGLTGDIVHKMTVKEGVDGGYLAKPSFRVIKEKSDSNFVSTDATEMNRKHLLHNPRVVAQVGRLVNLAANAGMPTLVLIDEIQQFTNLLPYLRHQVGFAHGTLTKDNISDVPEQYRKSDVKDLVDKFNTGEIKVLVGTSCVSTGTDLKPVKMLIYWQGGKSEIQVKQAIGRGTRKPPGKIGVTVVDFDISNIEILHKHAEARKEIYTELYPDVKEM